MQEVEWQRARHELYEDLKRSSQKQINRDAIRHVRQFFLSDGIKFAPKPYEFPTENDAVGLVCAALPKEYARLTVALGEELVALLPREEGTNHLTGYVNDVNTMHVTLFHTSHPDEMLPNARQRLPQDIEKLRKMAAQFQPLALVPHRVVLSPSGAIVLLFDVDENSQSDPFTVDRLREMAKHTFSPFPKRQSKTIMHTTLARLLDPDVPVDVVERIHRHCELLTERLLAERALCVVNELWFVDETHYYWASGRTTSIPLGGPSAE